MSQSKNQYEAERWFQTAQEDLQAAQILREADIYAHACFHAQQCGEKSLKAMWYLLDCDPWGHSIQRLVREFPELDRIADQDEWLQRGAFLDRFYIPTRYPNGLPDLTPGQSYFRQDADQAIEQANFFLDACRELLASA
ncbi:MAG: HEPN domain-containing protein [Chloroflexi bacterium]|nr:HEPN domain-containing protein [Chloroflexota bacterium]MBU1662306.1 HEPN domain-containing protein [Chloroflexota bacterium]